MTSKTGDWLRLDNAAIMFPPASSARNTRVFRFTCELFEDVEPEALQRALDRVVAQDQSYVCTLRSGLFWHYLERSREQPRIHPEKFTPCCPIYSVHKKRLLFYVSYYRRRIHIEMYHALTDGNGAMAFLQLLVSYYLMEVYGDELAGCAAMATPSFSEAQRREDSFIKNYRPQHGQAHIRMPRALQIRGRRTGDKHYNIIEAEAPVAEILALAHRGGATVTGLLCALYMLAIADGAPELDKRRPVSITVPFNLRNIFPSGSLRNFFATTNIRYDFSARCGTREDVIRLATEHLKSEETRRELIARMNSLVAMQRNPVLRIAPLPLKDLAISISKRLNERGETAVLSNLGRLELPEPLRPYVRLVSAASATSNMHLCVLTYGERLTMTFSSSLQENEAARAFLRMLTAEGVHVTVSSNYNQL